MFKDITIIFFLVSKDNANFSINVYIGKFLVGLLIIITVFGSPELLEGETSDMPLL